MGNYINRNQIAEKLGLSVQSVIKFLESGKVKPLKTKGARPILYSPETVARIAKVYSEGGFSRSGQVRNRSKVKSTTKTVALKSITTKSGAISVHVEITDVLIAEILQRKLGSIKEIEAFLVGKLEDVYKPILKNLMK